MVCLRWKTESKIGPSSRTSDNRKHIEPNILDLGKIDFQGFLDIDVSREGEGVSNKRPKDVCREKIDL